MKMCLSRRVLSECKQKRSDNFWNKGILSVDFHFCSYDISSINIQGMFGEVWKGLWNDRVEVAVKKMRAGSMDPDAFRQEAEVMKTLRVLAYINKSF